LGKAFQAEHIAMHTALADQASVLNIQARLG
jgi:hypothetical protein